MNMPRKDCYREILTQSRVFGFTNAEIAEELDVSTKLVCSVKSCFDLVQKQEWDTLEERIRRNGAFSEPLVRWCAEITGAELPERIASAMDWRNAERKKMRPDPVVLSETPAPESFPEPEPGPVMVQAPTTNEAVYLCRVLEELARTNELLEQFMDVVVPKYVADLKDNVNANADMLHKQLQKCESVQYEIRNNTRRRGA